MRSLLLGLMVSGLAGVGAQQSVPSPAAVPDRETWFAPLRAEDPANPLATSSIDSREDRAAQQSVPGPAGVPAQATAPPDTDIWLARLGGDARLIQPINITNRSGYDNQPSFTPDGTAILFTRRDGGQTDIYAYDFTSRSSLPTRVTNTPESEYSPTVTPDGRGVSVIRVEADGTQRLWRFTRDGQSPQVVLANVKPVGYHAWGPNNTLALFVLGNPNTLQVADTRTGRATTVAQRIGRSLHRIPGRDTISVLHIDGDTRWIKALDMTTRVLTPIVRAVDSADGDYGWTPDGSILMSDGKRMMRWKPGTEWTTVADLSALGLEGVSRIAISPDGGWIAMVAPDRR